VAKRNHFRYRARRREEERLHRAVGAVADPSLNAALDRLVRDERPICDALHAPAYDDMADAAIVAAHATSPTPDNTISFSIASIPFVGGKQNAVQPIVFFVRTPNDSNGSDE
jgi:hypothetical protein